MSLLVKQEIASLFLHEGFGAGFYYTLWHVTLWVSRMIWESGWESVESWAILEPLNFTYDIVNGYLSVPLHCSLLTCCSTSNTHSFNSCPVFVWFILLSQFLATSRIFLSYCYSKDQTQVPFQGKLNYSSALQVMPFSLRMLLVTCRVSQWWGCHLQAVWSVSSVKGLPCLLTFLNNWVKLRHCIDQATIGIFRHSVEGSLVIPLPYQLVSIVSLEKCHVYWVLSPRATLRCQPSEGSFVLYSVISWLQITIFLPTYFPLHVFTIIVSAL